MCSISTLYGHRYARVSTHEQSLSLQLDAFKKAKRARVFQEHFSSGSKSRPELAAALDVLREGDTLMVWRLDRLGRSMRELDDLITQFKKQGIRFSSLTEAIDTSTASGKLYFHIIAAFAEYEREGIRERTQAGVAAARGRGRKGGRKHKLSPAQRAMVINAYHSQTPIRDICHQFRISHTTIHRILKADKAEQSVVPSPVQAQPKQSRTRLAQS